MGFVKVRLAGEISERTDAADFAKGAAQPLNPTKRAKNAQQLVQMPKPQESSTPLTCSSEIIAKNL